MKVMQAYNATNNESPIPLPRAPIAPPTILPSSPVLPLSPMFDPQDFFIPEEILPPQKRARFLSSSSTNPFAPPQVFEIRENYHDAPNTSYLCPALEFIRLDNRNRGSLTRSPGLTLEDLGIRLLCPLMVPILWPATGSNVQPVSVTCHACGEKGHYRNQCPKANNSAYGIAYLLMGQNRSKTKRSLGFVPSFSTSSFIKAAPFEALYGRKCRSPVVGPKLEMLTRETRDNPSKLPKYCYKSEQTLCKLLDDGNRSYANVRQKPLEFQVGDHVILKVSPRKGVIRFKKRGKLNPRLDTSFSKAETLLLNWKTDVKSGSTDGGFVASVVGGGVGVDCGGGGVKDGIDCGMMVEYIGEDSVITETGTVRSVGVCLLGTS
ncbi:reverse transcriptase domain-containing protein [Tanacetum coccineum]